ncbi:MAG: CDP-glucose 4,6-dehydratase [Thermoguttaceae bacterium]
MVTNKYTLTMPIFRDVYNNRRVFVTGHTGFKGSWLVAWLERLGAVCCGFSLPGAVSSPDHFSLLNLNVNDVRGDVADIASLRNAIRHFEPEIVFHLAAQPLVRLSYAKPLETFTTNVIGTANLLEAARDCESVKAVVIITTDKVYENREWDWGYRENDRLGGHDPYAASKACAEIVVSSYRQSFYQSGGKLLASVRAGNVIGGGDWAGDRLIPDLVRAALKGETTHIRMPHATRPWEHVLEPLFGYLCLGQCLLEGQSGFADAWNFGPNIEGCISVGNLVEKVGCCWDRIRVALSKDCDNDLHETTLLYLNSDKARLKLGWEPVWSFDATLRHTIEWYREFYENKRVITLNQLERYKIDAAKKQTTSKARSVSE